MSGGKPTERLPAPPTAPRRCSLRGPGSTPVAATEFDFINSIKKTMEDKERAEQAENTSSSETDAALSVMRIEDMINRQLADISKMREEMKMVHDSFEDSFKNDAKFREFDDKAKEAAKQKNAYKQAMLKEPALAELSNKLDQLKGEVKDMQMALSDYLREYSRVTGLMQFETEDGQVLEIVQVYKLVKK